MSAQDKVNSYIRNLEEQPVEGPAPHPDLKEERPSAALAPLPPDGTKQMAQAPGVLNAHSPPFSPRPMMEPRKPTTSALNQRDSLLCQHGQVPAAASNPCQEPVAVSNPDHVNIFRHGPATGPNSGHANILCQGPAAGPSSGGVDVLRHGPAAASHSLGPPPGFSSLEPASKSRAVFPYPSNSISPPSQSVQPAGESLSAVGLSDLAKVLVRCRGSESLSDRFDGNPLNYYRFMRQVDDRILNIYGQSDPGHALHLLLEATEGRARRLIGNCVMLPPHRGLQEALHFLYNAFGSPQVAVRASIDAVCGGGVICNSEVGLEEFYSELVNCKIVLEAAGAQSILNSASTAERIFTRLPQELQRSFAKLAIERGYDVDIVPFSLFIEFVQREQRLLCSRFGRLLQPSAKTITKPVGRWRPRARANVVRTAKSNDASPALPSAGNAVVAKERPLDVARSNTCYICDSPSHHVGRCEVFLDKAVACRKELVAQKRLCYNCLGKGHGVKNCPSKARCRTCSRRHHTLLHPSDPAETKKESSPSVEKSPTKESPAVGGHAGTVSTVRGSSRRTKTRLQVIPVCVIDNVSGKCIDTLALLDSGADCHLMVAALSTELGLAGRPIRSEIQLASGRVEVHDTVTVECAVRGVQEEEVFTLENVRVVQALPDLGNSIPSQSDVDRNPHLAGIEIPETEAKDVQLIIGMESPGLHIFSEIRQNGTCSLWAGRTPLGWVLHGRDAQSDDTRCHVNLLLETQAVSALDALCPCQFDYVDRACDPDVLLPSRDDERAELGMKNSCTFDGGHFKIGIPWKEGCPNLPNNYRVAESRLKSLGRRLLADSELLAKYTGKIREMISQGYAIEVSADQDDPRNRTWYIPHHCVTSKFRVVFDCASRFGGTSLND